MASFVSRRGTAAALAVASAVGLMLAVQVGSSAIDGRERASSELQPLEGKPGAVLKGRVVLKGDAPDVAALSKQLAARMAEKSGQGDVLRFGPGGRGDPAGVGTRQGRRRRQRRGVDSAAGGLFLQGRSGKGQDVAGRGRAEAAALHIHSHVSWIMPQLVDPKDPGQDHSERPEVPEFQHLAHSRKT